MKRRYDYDVLRVLSMLGVIYLHTVAGALRELDNTVLWNFSNIGVAFATPAVPLFFMMSGALLLDEDKTSDLTFLFRRRLPKVLVPLVVWSTLVLLYTVLQGDAAGARESAHRLLNTPVVIPYWFLYALVPMYLLSPLLRQMTSRMTRAHWNYMMGLWILLTLGLYTVRSFVPDAWELTFPEHWTLNVNFVGGYLGYFLLGAWLERWERIPPKGVLAGIAAGMIALSIFGTRWDTYAHSAYSDRFTNYLTLFTMLLSAAIFLLAKSCLRGKEEKGKLLSLLAGVSFPVYLLHPLALGLGERVWGRVIGLPAPGTIPQQVLFYVLVVLFCIGVSVILSSIPGVCYAFTGQRYAAACKSANLFALFRPKKRPNP